MIGVVQNVRNAWAVFNVFLDSKNIGAEKQRGLSKGSLPTENRTWFVHAVIESHQEAGPSLGS